MILKNNGMKPTMKSFLKISYNEQLKIQGLKESCELKRLIRHKIQVISPITEYLRSMVSQVLVKITTITGAPQMVLPRSITMIRRMAATSYLLRSRRAMMIRKILVRSRLSLNAHRHFPSCSVLF